MSLASSSVSSKDYRLTKGPPISLETERRRTMRVVHQVEREVVAFREKWLKKARTGDISDDMHDLIQYVIERSQIKRFPKNIADFINLLGKVRENAETLYKKEVETIDAAVLLYKTYHETMHNLIGQLNEAVESHAGKYCHSFSSETGIHEIPSVLFYENNITKWRGQIKEAFTLLGDIMRNIKESAMTMELFVQNYPHLLHYMGLSMDVYPRIFNALKDWVTADEAYVRHLQDDMSQLKREKMTLDEMARRHKMAAGGIQSKVTRSQYHTKKLKEKLSRARDDRRQCRKRQLSLMEASTRIAADLSDKRQALDKSMQQFYKEGGPSNSAKVRLLDSSSSLSHDIAKLEKQMAALKSDLRSVKIERMAAQKEFHKMQVLVEKNTRLELDIQDDAYDATQDVHDLDEERRILGEKVIALARIRAIKTDLKTIKIIHAEGYLPGRKFDVPAELEEACQIPPVDIGRDWPSIPLSSPRRESGTGREQATDNSPNIAHRARTDNGHGAPPGGVIGGVTGAVGGSYTSRSTKSLIGDKRRMASREDDPCPTYRSLDRWQKVSQEASSNAMGRVNRSLKAAGGGRGGGGDGIRDVDSRQEFKVITVN